VLTLTHFIDDEGEDDVRGEPVAAAVKPLGLGVQHVDEMPSFVTAMEKHDE